MTYSYTYSTFSGIGKTHPYHTTFQCEMWGHDILNTCIFWSLLLVCVYIMHVGCVYIVTCQTFCCLYHITNLCKMDSEQARKWCLMNIDNPTWRLIRSLVKYVPMVAFFPGHKHHVAVPCYDAYVIWYTPDQLLTWSQHYNSTSLWLDEHMTEKCIIKHVQIPEERASAVDFLRNKCTCNTGSVSWV